jgi:ABC-type branched-subunit amino acid transport system substrate-binding protein
VQALLAGKDIHFNGATGALLFNDQGRVTSTAYDVRALQEDNSSKVIDTIQFGG